MSHYIVSQLHWLHRETPLAPKREREKGLLPVLVCAEQKRRQTVEAPNSTAFLSRQKQGCNVSPCSYCLGLEMCFPQHQGGKQQQRKHKLICSTSWANYLFLSSFPFLSVCCGGNTKIFLFVSKRLHSAHISLDIHFEAHSVCNHDAFVLGEQFLCCFESGVRSQLG